VPPRQVEAKAAVGFADDNRMVHAVHVGRHDEPSKKAIESRRDTSISMVEHLGSLGPSGAEASETLRLMRERGLVRSSQDSFRTLVPPRSNSVVWRRPARRPEGVIFMRESKGVWSPHNYACLRALSSSCARRRRTSQALST